MPAVDWSSVLGAQGGGDLLSKLRAMGPAQRAQAVAALPITDQQKQALLTDLQQPQVPQPAAPTAAQPQQPQLGGAAGAAPPGQNTPGTGLFGQPGVMGAPGLQTATDAPAPNATTSSGAAPLYNAATATTPDPLPFTGMTQDEMWKYATQALGYDAKAAYQAYARGVAEASANMHTSRYLHGEGAGPSTPLTATPPNAWLQQTITAVEGQFSPIIELFANYYGQETGQTMTADTRKQLVAQIQNSSPDVRAAMMAESIVMQQQPPPPTALQQKALSAATTPQEYQVALSQYQDSSAYKKWATDNQAAVKTLGNYIGTGGFLYNLFSSAVTSAPNVQSQLQQAAILKAFSSVGMMPTTADYAALAKATPDEIQQAIYTKPLPDDPKITYGQYQNVRSYVDPLYAKYFGTTPTKDQLMAYMGMNQSQITDHIMASPSKQLPGQTVGRYEQLRGFADTLVSKIGYGVSDQVIAAAHAGMQTP